MPKIEYESWNPTAASLALVEIADDICLDYAAQGFDLTLRQLYYQFVARGHIANNMRSYKNLGTVVHKARMAGLLDWDHIVDRTRRLVAQSHWGSPGDIIRSAARSFALDKWDDQPVRVEVWVEKEALAGVVERTAARYDCAWFSCRGYVSSSEQWAAAQRHLRYIEQGQRVHVIHLGDHDPSGIDMTRDVDDRLRNFIARDWAENNGMSFDADMTWWDIAEQMGVDTELDGEVHTIERIALNMNQVREYNPPPNPAKITDSRAAGYIEKFGGESWELDALDPIVLDGLIEAAILRVIDIDRWNAQLGDERQQREILTATSQRWLEVRDFLTTS